MTRTLLPFVPVLLLLAGCDAAVDSFHAVGDGMKEEMAKKQAHHAEADGSLKEAMDGVNDADTMTDDVKDPADADASAGAR